MKKIYFSISALLISVSTFAGLNTTFSIEKGLEQVSEVAFTTYMVSGETADADFSQASNTVVISVLEGTDVSALVPTFTVSDGATAVLAQVSQTSGETAVDFSSGEVVYQIVNGDSSADWTVKVNFTVGVKETGLENVSMYPNPVNEMLTVTNLNNASQIIVSNVIGQTLLVKAINTVEMNISTSNLEAGIYIVTVVSETGSIRSERIIKK